MNTYWYFDYDWMATSVMWVRLMMEQLRKKLATSVDKFFTTSQMMMTGVGQ
jgi:hypothetical protein